MEIIQLWDEIPGYEEGHHSPYLKYFRSENKKGNGTVVILPGGGYAMRAAHEGDGYAELLNGFGLDCFVLEYRVSPTRFPYPLLDARRAMRYVRANAEKYGIDPQKIAIMGSSAGGHLAATTSTMWTEDQTRPDFSVLIYPVITMEVGLTHKGTRERLITEKAIWQEHKSEKYSLDNQVTRFTPPTFIAHCSDDFTVPIENSLRYYNRLIDCEVDAEMHIWPKGAHGWGFSSEKFKGKGNDKFSYARDEFYMVLERWLAGIRK